MSTPIITDFKGTGFAVVTSYGAGAALTGISNANPAVVTRTAHGLADNDVVKIAGVVGMTEINDLQCVVEVIDANSFSLIGVDSMNFDVYVSGGTVAKATFTSSCQVTGYSGPTGTTPSNTTDTNCGSAKSYGVPQHGSVELSFAVADQAYIRTLVEAQKVAAQVVHRYTLPKSRGLRFDIGTVVAVDPGSAQANGTWAGTATIERDVPFIDVEA
jgi:Ubiquitin-activating enzyme E1 FCCH domain